MIPDMRTLLYSDKWDPRFMKARMFALTRRGDALVFEDFVEDGLSSDITKCGGSKNCGGNDYIKPNFEPLPAFLHASYKLPWAP